MAPFQLGDHLRVSWPVKNQAPLRKGGHGNPSRQACQAVCFRDELSSVAADTLVFRDETSSVAADASISCTTFNILAPIYKRINGEGCRESQFRESWLSRNQRILDLLLLNNSSIICLQEFWLGNHELVHLYEENLCKAGYHTYKLARTNNRGDGLLTAIKGERFRVLYYKELLFNDCGDRVAQFFHLQSKVPCFQRSQNAELELLLVNTHLLFPHDFNYCLIRLRQAYKILECVEEFKMEHGLTSIPVILCGDWNGSKRGRVYKFLRSQGYLSSYDTAHEYTDEDSHRWISHRNHRGNICKVDFIWLLNPDMDPKPLSASWNEAMLGTIKAKLCQVGLRGRDAFYFFQSEANNNVLTFQDFQQGLQQLGLTEACSEGLTKMEIQQLMQIVDTDGNGVIGYNEFEALLAVEGSNSTLVSPKGPIGIAVQLHDASTSIIKELMPRLQEVEELWTANGTTLQKKCKLERLDCFNIKEAFLFPPEVENGFWPEEYSLSDHAALTVTFTSPRERNRMPLLT